MHIYVHALPIYHNTVIIWFFNVRGTSDKIYPLKNGFSHKVNQKLLPFILRNFVYNYNIHT